MGDFSKQKNRAGVQLGGVGYLVFKKVVRRSFSGQISAVANSAAYFTFP